MLSWLTSVDFTDQKNGFSWLFILYMFFCGIHFPPVITFCPPLVFGWLRREGSGGYGSFEAERSNTDAQELSRSNISTKTIWSCRRENLITFRCTWAWTSTSNGEYQPINHSPRWGMETEAMSLGEVRRQMKPCGEVPRMDQFKALRAGLAPHLSTKMDGSICSDPETSIRRVVEIDSAWSTTNLHRQTVRAPY